MSNKIGNLKPKVHIAGIGGEGWSWIAKILIERGWHVTGCDAKKGPRVLELESMGFSDFSEGNSATHITSDLDYFLYSSALLAYPENKKEYERALELGVKTYDRNKFFPVLLEGQDVIAIAGTHGKTTTTSLVAYLLDSLGNKCGFGIGGIPANFGTNGRSEMDGSNTFVIEADEFGEAFLGLEPSITVITSLEMDHHDYFSSMGDYVGAFAKFLDKTKNFAIGYGDSTDIKALLKSSNKPFLTYGFGDENDIILSNLKIEGFSTKWNLKFKNLDIDVQAEVPFPGEQYALNATAALAVIHKKGFDLNEAISKLINFKGVGRRFERQEKNGIIIVNDYGHHPTELKVTVEAALKTGKRVVVVYEPHQYKRCVELKDQFKNIFNGAAKVFQTQIYSSRESPPYGINDDEFFKVVNDGLQSEYVSNWEDLPEKVKPFVKPGDLVLIFAVGHGDQIAKDFMEVL